MNIEEYRDRMAMVVMECTFVWRSDGVPAEKRREMRRELIEHLLDAAHDGRPVESVVGDDVEAFAAEWGAPHRPPNLRRRRILESATYTFAGMPLYLAAQHFRHRSSSFPLDIRMFGKSALRALGVAAFLEIALRARLRAEKPGTTLAGPIWRDPATSFAATALPYAALLGVNFLINGGRRSALKQWSWKATLLTATVGATLIYRRRKTHKAELSGMRLSDVRRELESRLRDLDETSRNGGEKP